MRGRGVGRMNGRGYKRTIVEMETSDFDDGRSKDNRNSSACGLVPIKELAQK